MIETDAAPVAAPLIAGPRTSAPARPSLLHDRDYVALLLGQGVSSLGDAATFVALPLLVLMLTGSGLAMGIVGILQTAPDLIVGLPAGAYADRWDRRRMMIVADLGRALLTSLIPLAALAGLPTIVVILVVVGPINVLRVFFTAALSATIPALAGRDRLAAGTGYLEAVYGLGYVLGPALAGLLITIIGPGPTLAIDALSFLVSTGCIVLIHRPLTPPGDPSEARHLRQQLAEGLRFTWQHPVLRFAIGFAASFNLATAAFVPAFTYFLIRERGSDPPALGLMLSIWAVGTLGGALVAARSKSGRLGVRMLAGGLIFGVGLTAATAAPWTEAVAILGFIVGAAYSTVSVAYVTIRTANSPDAMLGRVASLARTITIGVQPIGMLAGGLLIDALGGAATLMAMGIGTLTAATLFGVVRALRSAEVGAA